MSVKSLPTRSWWPSKPCVLSRGAQWPNLQRTQDTQKSRTVQTAHPEPFSGSAPRQASPTPQKNQLQ